MEFREWMRKRRKLKCWSQKELAEISGVSYSLIMKAEAGVREPRDKTRRKILRALAKTNGDAMRQMDDGELAFLIQCPNQQCKTPRGERDCYQCKTDWLKEPREPKCERGLPT